MDAPRAVLSPATPEAPVGPARGKAKGVCVGSAPAAFLGSAAPDGGNYRSPLRRGCGLVQSRCNAAGPQASIREHGYPIKLGSAPKLVLKDRPGHGGESTQPAHAPVVSLLWTPGELGGDTQRGEPPGPARSGQRAA